MLTYVKAVRKHNNWAEGSEISDFPQLTQVENPYAFLAGDQLLVAWAGPPMLSLVAIIVETPAAFQRRFGDVNPPRMCVSQSEAENNYETLWERLHSAAGVVLCRLNESPWKCGGGHTKIIYRSGLKTDHVIYNLVNFVKFLK